MNQLSSTSVAAEPLVAAENLPPALCFVGTSDVRLWGMTPAERLVRGFARHGITEIVDEADLPDIASPAILLRADAVLDAPLVTALTENCGLVLLGNTPDHCGPVAAHAGAGDASAAAAALRCEECVPALAGRNMQLRRPEELDAAFWKALRKRETPYAMVVDENNLRAVEWRVFMGTYKGATDFVTKYIWPRPAFIVTRLLAPLGVTPNMVTALSAICVVVAYFEFLAGEWTLGLIAAWSMTFLDTVDGKLARVTLTSSKWGDVFDHGIDLVHPPFWYSAWAVAVMASPNPLDPSMFWICLTVILGGYVLQRIIEGLSIKLFALEIHIWRPIDTLFRQVTARRNPNLVIMTASVLVGRPDWGILAVAAWTLVCLLLHMLQLGQAAVARSRRGRLESWMSGSAHRP